MVEEEVIWGNSSFFNCNHVTFVTIDSGYKSRKPPFSIYAAINFTLVQSNCCREIISQNKDK